MTENVVWRYDDTDTFLIGPNPRLRAIPHKGEHHLATYKGHALRVLRVVKPMWPEEPHSELVQSWQGECDGVEVPGMVAEQSNTVAEALIAHVDALG